MSDQHLPDMGGGGHESWFVRFLIRIGFGFLQGFFEGLSESAGKKQGEKVVQKPQKPTVPPPPQQQTVILVPVQVVPRKPPLFDRIKNAVRNFAIGAVVFVAIVGVIAALLPRTKAPAPATATDPTHPQFLVYTENGFRFELPSDLTSVEKTDQDGTNFRNADGSRLMTIQTGTADGAPSQWLASGYSSDGAYAKTNHVVQNNGSKEAYVFPGDGHTWSDSGDFYVYTWDDSNGYDHYKAKVAVPDNGGTKWAVFELVIPLSAPEPCNRAPEYQLDTLLYSVGVRGYVRDPGCPAQ